ncbi:MAG: DUF1289 domain-containing protein [Thalassobaculum sp.]
MSVSMMNPQQPSTNPAAADVPRTIASPCVGVCQIDRDTRFCLGCWRTIEEIAHWSRYGDPQRLEVLERLRERQREAGQDRRRVTRRRQARQDSAGTP